MQYLGLLGAGLLFIAGAAAGITVGEHNGLAEMDSQGTVIVRPCADQRAKGITTQLDGSGAAALIATCDNTEHLVRIQ